MAKGAIAVAISGGMDSLRAAVILQEQGYEVVGLFMSIENLKQDLPHKLKFISERFRLPIFKVNAQKVFEEMVITPFVDSYLKGLTPNPCVICNSTIKFGFLLDLWKSRGKEICSLFGISSEPLPFMATGHYVTPGSCSHRYGLMRHRDESKDQSYFLYRLSQEQLRHAIFPLALETKRDVFRWISSIGIGSIIGVESQEICFVPSGDYASFLERRVPALTLSKGPIKDSSGRILGYHRGLHRYTIGQRRGIGIPSSAPYYVLKISPKDNTLYVGRRDELFSRLCYVQDLQWVSIECPGEVFRAHIKIRNQHEPTPGTIEPIGEDQVLVKFDVPQKAVTPGQSAVFYDGAWLLGGGIISSNGEERS
ncbi:MAG: tRNA 2-thiouridine(34) synthase MnmA [Syntrophobacterales bacterium]|nr:tRNA 2-thiouridine(34) synthase MnmA [Syntrophobacterales bacterium]